MAGVGDRSGPAHTSPKRNRTGSRRQITTRRVSEGPIKARRASEMDHAWPAYRAVGNFSYYDERQTLTASLDATSQTFTSRRRRRFVILTDMHESCSRAPLVSPNARPADRRAARSGKSTLAVGMLGLAFVAQGLCRADRHGGRRRGDRGPVAVVAHGLDAAMALSVRHPLNAGAGCCRCRRVQLVRGGDEEGESGKKVAVDSIKKLRWMATYDWEYGEHGLADGKPREPAWLMALAWEGFFR